MVRGGGSVYFVPSCNFACVFLYVVRLDFSSFKVCIVFCVCVCVCVCCVVLCACAFLRFKPRIFFFLGGGGGGGDEGELLHLESVHVIIGLAFHPLIGALVLRRHLFQPVALRYA